MKKLLLLSATAFLAFAANAQDISVTVQGQAVQNGSTVDSYCLEREDFHQTMPNGQVFDFSTYTLNPHVEASAPDGDYQITVKNTTAGTVPITSILFCWPENCLPIAQGATLSNVGPLYANEPSELAIDTEAWEDPIETVFTLTCSVEIVSVSNPSNKFSFTLNMIHDPNHEAGIEGIIDDYNGPVEYYDLTGRKITNPQPGKIVIERRGSKAFKKIFR